MAIQSVVVNLTAGSTAIINASVAKSVADSALSVANVDSSAASTAKSVADSALSNAAIASSAASVAVINASTAKAEADSAIGTNPAASEFKITAIKRDSNGSIVVSYDDSALGS